MRLRRSGYRSCSETCRMPLTRLRFLCGGPVPEAGTGNSQRQQKNSRHWQAVLCDELGLVSQSDDGTSTPVDENGLPVGDAIHHETSGDAFPVGSCLRADPVHLVPDRDSALLMPPESLALTEEELDQLLNDLNAFLSDDGLRVFAPNAHRWYLCGTELPSLHRPVPEQLAYRSLEVLQTFETAESRSPLQRRLKTLASEIEMFLYTHSVNEQRRSRQQPTVTSLYFWGGLTPLVPKNTPGAVALVGSHPWVSYAASIADIPVLASATLAEVLDWVAGDERRSESSILVLETDERNAWLAGDKQMALQARARFEEHWLAPAQMALESGRISCLTRSWDDGLHESFLARRHNFFKRCWQRMVR